MGQKSTLNFQGFFHGGAKLDFLPQRPQIQIYFHNFFTQCFLLYAPHIFMIFSNQRHFLRVVPRLFKFAPPCSYLPHPVYFFKSKKKPIRQIITFLKGTQFIHETSLYLTHIVFFAKFLILTFDDSLKKKCSQLPRPTIPAIFVPRFQNLIFFTFFNNIGV